MVSASARSARCARCARAPRQLLGVVGSWLRTWTTQEWHPRDHVESLPAVPPSAMRVLVVDDDPVNLMVMAARLTSRGLDPVSASDGAEAVALASELSFDLILMDLEMPILDGLEATWAIRRDERASARPAVPIVAHSSRRLNAGALAAYGMNDQLPKPCEARALEICLQRWLPAYRCAARAGAPHVLRAVARRRSWRHGA